MPVVPWASVLFHTHSSQHRAARLPQECDAAQGAAAAAQCSMLLGKLRGVAAQLGAATYTPATVPALQRLSQHVEAGLAGTAAKLQQVCMGRDPALESQSLPRWSGGHASPLTASHCMVAWMPALQAVLLREQYAALGAEFEELAAAHGAALLRGEEAEAEAREVEQFQRLAGVLG